MYVPCVADARIDNPILNSPFRVSERHYRFGSDGITGDIVDGRCLSSHFVPIPKSRSQLPLVQLVVEGRLLRPFGPPSTGRVAGKVVYHDGDEVLNVYDIG